MKNTFCLEKNANNISLMKINDTIKICITDLDTGIVYFIGEKEDKVVPKDLLAFGPIKLVDFLNKRLEIEVKLLRGLESDNLYAEAKINATTLMIAGKVMLESKYVTREDIIAYEALLNKHESYLIAEKSDKIINHEESISDSFSASPVSY